jgi:hypothetical protein
MISWFIASALLTSQFPLVKTDISLLGQAGSAADRRRFMTTKPARCSKAASASASDQAFGKWLDGRLFIRFVAGNSTHVVVSDGFGWVGFSLSEIPTD